MLARHISPFEGGRGDVTPPRLPQTSQPSQPSQPSQASHSSQDSHFFSTIFASHSKT